MLRAARADGYDALVSALRPVSAAMLAAIFIAGCGAAGGSSTEKFKGEQRAVAEAVSDLEEAAQRGDAQRICDDLLAKPVVDRLIEAGRAAPEKRDCAQTLDESLKDADTFDLEVTKIVITGPHAVATVRSDAGNKDRDDNLAFVKEGRNWKLLEIP